MRLFVAVITDPRPGHDFGKQHPFNYDYSYWSLTVSRPTAIHVIITSFVQFITVLVSRLHQKSKRLRVSYIDQDKSLIEVTHAQETCARNWHR